MFRESMIVRVLFVILRIDVVYFEFVDLSVKFSKSHQFVRKSMSLTRLVYHIICRNLCQQLFVNFFMIFT